ncbi:RNA recognition motif domain protein [Metarhizium guizhouense ARSEF 977]|uniref:RNA recognition motif domain protein n=1 Tax=Metarhizium guizhouense (strain ARSEF 977) TaxID=1276136 RepID=A0A0B4H1A0_METGA|nr:RNA recognition motif domain protein [Metarhizium guizhouense ARSEF 977]
MEQAQQSQPDDLAARIYLGNLPYTAKPYDIEELLAANGFDHFEKIHISIDPVSGRNPGYCFVDFPNRDTAGHALASLSATISGRPVKVGPCDPKKQRDRGGNHEADSSSRRWGDWSTQSSDGGIATGRFNTKGAEQGPYWAVDHFENMVESHEGRRLYVGGLGRMIDQAQHNREITELFSDFTPTAIGKRITPYERTRFMPGNHHYCFVDFETREQANAAKKALHGRTIPGGRLKVSVAGGIPNKLANPDTGVRYGRSVYDGSRSGNTVPSNRAAASTDWRRGDNE